MPRLSLRNSVDAYYAFRWQFNNCQLAIIATLHRTSMLTGHLDQTVNVRCATRRTRPAHFYLYRCLFTGTHLKHLVVSEFPPPKPDMQLVEANVCGPCRTIDGCSYKGFKLIVGHSWLHLVDACIAH